LRGDKRLDFEEICVARCVRLIPLPEFDMIRHQAQFAAIDEDAMKLTQCFILDHSALVMASLWPRIAEIQVNHLGDRVAKSKATELGGISMHNANIFQTAPSHAICCVTPELGRPFNAEKIRIGLLDRLLDEKSSFA